jgi:hypothetical protein
MITHTPPERCDTSASVREIQRKSGRYRGVRDGTGSAFCVIESALIETSVARIAGAGVASGANPIRLAAEQTDLLAVVGKFRRRN